MHLFESVSLVLRVSIIFAFIIQTIKLSEVFICTNLLFIFLHPQLQDS